jgi:hypothetical protein
MWPKGKPRKGYKAKTKSQAEPATEQPPEKQGLSWRAKMKAEAAGTWRDESSDSLFDLPEHVHAYLGDHGLVAQWCTESVMGQPVEQLCPVGDQRRFWTAVQEGDLPDFHGVERGGMRLHVRPVQLQAQAEEYRQNEATRRLRDHEESILGGNIGGITLDAGHASARASNKVRHGYERVAVVGDE